MAAKWTDAPTYVAFSQPSERIVDVEAVLARADVEIKYDPYTMTRTVISRNVVEPLTENEKAIIVMMWRNQGIRDFIEFKEGTED